MNKGRGWIWVLGMLALGGLATFIALFYWMSPPHAVRQTFTLFHSLLIREKKDTAALLVAREVTFEGSPLSRGEFLKVYALPTRSEVPLVAPCPIRADHWQVAMLGRSYCYLKEERTWRLHWLAAGPCACR